MEVKKIVEGMTAVEVAEVIDSNFKNQNKILEEDIAKQNSVIGVSEYKDFSEAEAVNLGDVRKYNGFLYECVEATTGVFDASKWKKSSFKAETEKKLTELASKVSSYKPIQSDVVNNCFIQSNGTIYNFEGYNVKRVYVNEGDTVFLKGRIDGKDAIAATIFDDKGLTNPRIDKLYVARDNVSTESYYKVVASISGYLGVTVELSQSLENQVEIYSYDIHVVEDIDSLKSEIAKSGEEINDLSSHLSTYNNIECDVVNNCFIQSNGTIYNFEGYEVKRKYLKKGDVIYIKGKVEGGSAMVATMFDDENLTKPRTDKVYVSRNLVNETEYYKLVIPIDGYLGVTVELGQPKEKRIDVYKYEKKNPWSDIDEINKDLDMDYYTVINGIVKDKCFIQTNGLLYNFSGYFVRYINVLKGDIIFIKGKTATGSVLGATMYEDDSFSTPLTGKVYINKDNIKEDVYLEVVIPVDGILAVTVQNNYEPEILFYKKRNSKIKDYVECVADKYGTRKKIYCWGDSLTAGGAYQVNNPYPLMMENMLEDSYQVINCGVGGETVQTIAARQGCMPVIVNSDFILPSTIQPVNLGKLYNIDGFEIKPLRQGEGNSVNNVNVDGMDCYLRRNGEEYTIERVTEGEQRTIKKGSVIAFKGSQFRDAHAVVLWFGTNGEWESVDELVAAYKQFIRYSNTNNYVIIGLHYSGFSDRFEELEYRFTKEFGLNYINWRKYGVEHGLEDAGIEPTSQDIEDVNDGLFPSSLRVDNVHLTEKAYELLTKLIMDRMKIMNIVP